MNRFALTALAATPLVAALLAAPALAAGLAEPVAEPIIAPAAPLAFGPSFAGAHAGGSVGYTRLESGFGDGLTDALAAVPGITDIADGGLDDADGDVSYGAHAGYLFQRGALVFGPELSVFGSQVEAGGTLLATDAAGPSATEVETDLDHGVRLVARGGVARDRTLVYGLAGVSHAEADFQATTVAGDGAVGVAENSGEDVGYSVGVGVEHLVNDRVSVGVQYVHDRFDDFDGADFGLEDQTIEGRVSFRF